MDILGFKDSSLRSLISQLAELLPPNSFVLVDNWEADPFAIGLAKPSDHKHLVYLTSDCDRQGRYFLSRELPARHDLEVFHDAGSDHFADVPSLAKAVAEHLCAA